MRHSHRRKPSRFAWATAFTLMLAACTMRTDAVRMNGSVLIRSGAGQSVAPTVTTTRAPDPLDEIITTMSPEDKVGQLFLVAFNGATAEAASEAIAGLRAGGIVLLANATTADAARLLTSDLQQIARENSMLPLLIATDHEGGSVQRIRDGVTSFGSNWALGSVQPAEVAFAAACSRGATHGRELAALGINMNLAPVLDVWDNPHNTVIAERSYSDDASVVGRLGAAYIEALQAHGVLAVGKHFPGHGSTTEDSHLTLPIVRHDRARLDAVELVPFRSAIRASVAAIMTAHVSYPLLDAVPSRPASLSPVIVSDLLRRDLGFDGLVITDDLGLMRAVTDRYDAGEAAVQAVLAGADMLTVVGPVDSQRRMAEAISAQVGGSISRERLDNSVRRVLKAKQQAGLIPLRALTAPPSPAPCEGG